MRARTTPSPQGHRRAWLGAPHCSSWRLAALLAALLSPLPGFARPVAPASTTTPGQAASLPLYGGLQATDPFFYVEARAGGQPLFLRIESSSAEVRLTSAAAARVGARPRGRVGRIDVLGLGPVSLTHVVVEVDRGDPLAYGVDGTIGLLAFPNVSWAVLPSAGVVAVAPASEGAALVKALDVPPASQVDPAHLHTRRVRIGGSPVELRPDVLLFPGLISGAALLAAWDTGAGTTATNPEPPTAGGPPSTPLPAVGSWSYGTAQFEPREVFGILAEVRHGIEASPWLPRVPATVGIDVAEHFDLALDNAGHQAAVRPASGLVKADYGPALEARLVAAVPPEDGTAVGAQRRFQALGAVATFLHVRGRSTDEAVARKLLTALAPGDCEAWLAYGEVLLDLGRPADAAAPLTKADELQGPPGTCSAAPGKLAYAKLLQGDLAGVEELYRRPTDDPGLARAAGLAAWLRGDEQAAQTRFLQAVAVNQPGDDEAARIGLFVAGRTDDRALASEQLRPTRFRYDGRTDLLTLALWADDRRAAGTVLADLQALAQESPVDPVILAQLTREQERAAATGGSPESAAQAKETRLRALGVFEAALASTPRDGRMWADYAIFLVTLGSFDDAREAVHLARLFAPGCADTWLATAMLASLDPDGGTGAEASDFFKRAGTVGYENPAYATLRVH